MSLAAMKKVTLCGLSSERDRLLSDLQALGVMHLLTLAKPAAHDRHPDAEEPVGETARKALRFLADTPDKRRQIHKDEAFDPVSFAEEVNALKEALRDAKDERDFLETRIAAVRPWGGLHLPPLEALGGRRFWFYVLPARALGRLRDVETPWRVVAKEHGLAYVVLMAKDEPPADLLPEPRVHVGSEPLDRLCERLDAVEARIDELTAQRRVLSRRLTLFAANLAAAEDRAALNRAARLAYCDDHVVAVQGWAPEQDIERVVAMAADRDLACLVETPAPEDQPPTLIRQPAVMSAAADLAQFYQSPSSRAWDPSVALFASTALFFAMIVADAGYALILSTMLAFFWGRLGRSAKGRGYRALALACCAGAAIYGVLVGSYFGAPPPAGSVWSDLRRFDLRDFDQMMRLSIVVGTAHLVLANLAAAWASRRSPTAFASLGWCAVIGGALALWWFRGGDETTMRAAGALAGSGLAAVVLFSGGRRAASWSAVAWNAFDGARALTRIMTAFGDVMSYLRLFALALAGASLGATFNAIAADVRAAAPGLGLLGALLILAFGHGLNFALAVLSAVVHGLRLNFIEFYHWGLPEAGAPFQPFKRKEVGTWTPS